MPYEWLPPEGGNRRLHLWPHRSLPRRGFVAFIAATAVLIALPLLVLVGSPVLWGLLPFFVLALAGVYYALSRSYRDGEILEDLTLAADRMTLIRHGPRGQRRDWEANPHWVRVERHEKGGPVPHYLTLKGGPREVEIGSFLSEEERLRLEPELRQALHAIRQPDDRGTR
ncbi:MAG: DUF2244 domain-containing protein [Pseudorhodobacter sp.]